MSEKESPAKNGKNPGTEKPDAKKPEIPEKDEVKEPTPSKRQKLAENGEEKKVPSNS